MTRLLKNLELPLLARELRELANRRRTYVMRVVYAALLFWFALAAFTAVTAPMSGRMMRLSILGSGDLLFRNIVYAQFAGIHIFMPALGCAALTSEKERNTLGALFLTRLGPWRILFEKLCSRLVPMVSCLLLSMPMLALAYSLGGLDQNFMVNGVILLFLTAVQVASLSLLCSVCCRTTVSALVWSYLAQAILLFLMLFSADAGMRGERGNWMLSGWLLLIRFGYDAPGDVCIGMSLRIYLFTIVMLILARVFLIRRAFLPARSQLLRFFKWVDVVFVRINNRLARGIVLVRESTSLPDQKPVSWRETSKRSLGTVRYLVRVLVVLELPTLFVCVFTASASATTGFMALTAAAFLLWALALLIVSIKAATLFTSERASQTLDVLLAAPLRTHDIVVQKCAGVRRTLLVVSVPILTTVFFQSAVKGALQQNSILYVVWAVLCVIIYLPLTAWISLWIGMRVRSQTKAIFTAVAVMVVWYALPGLVMRVGFEPVPRLGLWAAIALTLLGPSTGLVLNETGWVPYGFPDGPIFVMLFNSALYGGLLWFVRHRVLKQADVLLGRNPTPSAESAAMIPVHQPAREHYEPNQAVS